jgi:hypothetical protein
MNIGEQCISLEYAKKLKDIGICQRSLLWHHKVQCSSEYVSAGYGIAFHGNESDTTFSAFTASELMDLLPGRVTINNDPDDVFNSFRIRIEKSFTCNAVNEKIQDFRYIYFANYYCDTMETTGKNALMARRLFDHNHVDEKFADCLAKILISLFENGYIKI